MSHSPLYAFQQKALASIAVGLPVYLGFDPGLGKSRTAIEAAKARKAKRILVACPASGRYVWEQQVKLWSDYKVTVVRTPIDLRRDGFLILTYGLISQKDSFFVKEVLRGVDFDMTVLDEAAALKNAGANRTKAIFGKMLPKLGYTLPMSGTPAPNHAGELYPVLKALYPEALMTSPTGSVMQQFQFENLFCKVASKRFGSGPMIRVIEGSKNLPELRKRISPFMLRIRKEEVLKDLPPVRYDVIPLGVDPQSAASLPQIPNMTDQEFLKFLGSMGDEHVMRLRRMIGLLKAQPAIEYIDEFLEGLPSGRKVLVFAHHRDVINLLVAGLQNWRPTGITGASSPIERAKAVDTFLQNDKCRLFIGNIQASGTGLTLMGPHCHCSDVIFVEASYSVGDNVQAAARVHRIGQSEAVVARFLTAHGTIDDRIQEILTRKAQDFASLFN